MPLIYDIMIQEEALDFLRQHQPMPKDEDLTADIINKYNEIRLFFIEHKSKECIPLFLNSFGYINGLGVYQLVEDVILQFSMEDIIPYMKEALKSNIYSIRYWNVQIAANYPSFELLPMLTDLLKEDDFDIKYNTLTALRQFDNKVYIPILEEYLKIEKEKELIDVTMDILNE
jgi:hypothetical protein